MKRQFLLLAITAAAISSCTTAYRTGQTPDDVYYSPARPQDEYVRVQEDDDRYKNDDEYYDDRYLRMKVSNRYRWNDLNDWYSYDRYSFGYNYHYGSYYNPYNSWNYYYNPYYCCCNGNYNYSNPKVASVKPVVKPVNFNLAGYTNNNYNNANSNTNGKSVIRNNNSRPSYNNTNSNGSSKGAGGVIRTIFESNNNNSNSGSSNPSPSRSYTPSNSNSSSSGSSGSSSGGSSSGGSVKRPGRD